MELPQRLRWLLKRTRHHLSRRPPEMRTYLAASTANALGRLAARGHAVNTVVDVGASNGVWSDIARKHYPDANYLLIEAQAYHRAALDAYCARHERTRYVLAAAGPKRDEFIYFNADDAFVGLAQLEETEGAHTKLPVTTVDDEVRDAALSGPYLLKLDTHGFEVPILDGAVKTLAEASIVVIEVYNFPVTHDSLLFWEMCRHMDERGFSVADFSEPMWRPRDKALWQLDLLFVPTSSAERQYRAFV